MLAFIAIIATGYGAGHLILTLLGQKQPASLEKTMQNIPTALTQPAIVPPQKPWVDIFGTYRADEPAPEITPPEITLVSNSFTLKGLFASAINSWAIIADPNSEYLVRKGDELPGGALVSDINTEGVWLKTSQGRELIAFGE